MVQGKESACNAGDTGDAGSIPASRRSPGGGNGNPLQYSCLENPMDRGAWRATVQGTSSSVRHDWACICGSFCGLINRLTLNSIPLFRNTTIFLFTHLLKDILIVSSFWWIMNKAAINIHVQVQRKISPVLGKYQIIKFLGHIGSHRVGHNWSDLAHMHIVRIHVVLLKTNKQPNCLSNWLKHLIFPLGMNESFCSFTVSSTFDVSVADFGHSNRCVVLFQFPFPWWYMIWNIFSYYLATVYLLCLLRSWPIFQSYCLLLLNLKSSLYILYLYTHILSSI